MTGRPLQHDLAGKRFGMVTAIEHIGRGSWLYRCDCGGVRTTTGANLRNGRTMSCGCNLGKVISEKQTKPWSKHKSEVEAYKGMMRRCFDDSREDFQWYGAKGITVCPRWLHGEGGKNGVECFLEDMGLKPSKRHSLDRINGTKGYSPDNCRWATPLTQSRNRSIVRRDRGETLAEIAERTGLSLAALKTRFGKGDRGDVLRRPAWSRKPLYRKAS